MLCVTLDSELFSNTKDEITKKRNFPLPRFCETWHRSYSNRVNQSITPHQSGLLSSTRVRSYKFDSATLKPELTFTKLF